MPPIAKLHIIRLGNTAVGDILTTTNTKYKDVLKYFNFHSVLCYDYTDLPYVIRLMQL